MLRICGQLRLSEYDGLYDLIVDKNHLLRKMKLRRASPAVSF